MTTIAMRSCAGGEVSEALKARPDIPNRLGGFREQTGWITTREGAVTTRPGFEFGALTKSQDPRVRLVPFVFAPTDAIQLEFGANYVRFIVNNALVTTGAVAAWATSTAYVPGDVRQASDTNYYLCVVGHTSSGGTEPPNGTWWYLLTDAPDASDGAILEWPTLYSLADLADLGWDQVYDVITLTHPDHAPHELTRYSLAFWTLHPARHASKVPPPTNIAFTSSGTGSGNFTLGYYVTAVRIDTYDESLPGSSGSVGTAIGQGIDATFWDSDLDFQDVGHGLETGDEIIILSVTTTSGSENPKIFLEGRSFRVDAYDVDYFTLKDTAGLIEPAVTAAAWSGLTITWARNAAILTNRVLPKGSGGTAIALEWDDADDVLEWWVYRKDNDNDPGFIGATRNPSFVDDGNEAGGNLNPDTEFTPPTHATPFRREKWPRRIAYHQQRQAFASTLTDPFEITVSRLGDLRDYSRHIPLLDGDSFSFEVAGLQANSVTGLVSLGGLLILTTGAIWVALGDQNGSLVPAAPNLRQVTYRGAGDVRPVVVDSTLIYTDMHTAEPFALYVEPFGTGTDRQGGRPMHDFARHLFGSYLIERLAYAATPHSLVWALRSDGVPLACTYIPTQNMLAWHRHPLAGTDAAVHDIASIPEGGTDRLYAVVSRTIDGTPTYGFERLAEDLSGSFGYDLRSDARFLDGSIFVDGTNAGAITLTLTGGTTWAAGETGLTLTSSAGLFAGSGADVGKGYRLVGADLEEVEVIVTADGSTTVQTVTLLTAAPASTRATATASWVAMVTAIAGLDHLEAETVYALADGIKLGPFTVASGAISLGARPYGLVHVGVLPSRVLETHDADYYENDTPLDKPIRVAGVAACLMHARGLSARAALGKELRAFKMPDDPLTLQTATVRVDLSGHWDRGRFLIEQTFPGPATVTALIPSLEIGERR